MFLKTRKILIILLMLTLAISMITTVNAADITIDANTPGGIKEAVKQAKNGDTILLKDGVYAGADNTGVIIAKDIKIKGLGSKVVIDGQGKNQIIKINKKKKVTIENIHFTKGFSTKQVTGGAITVEYYAELTVKNSKFTNNQVKGKYRGGGAILSEGRVIISKSTFTNNQASSHGGAIVTNGPVSWSSGSPVINDCTFTNNQAGESGGAVYSNARSLDMNKCTFTNNKATKSGGAIFIGSGKSNKITNSKFIKNTAGAAGAILIGKYCKTTVSKSTFNNNKARLNHPCGAICVNADVSIVDCKFSKNIGGKKYDTFHKNVVGKITQKNVKISPKDGTKVK